MFDWKELFRHWFGPKDYIKRRCPVDGFPMYKESDGVYYCPKGHTIDPNKRFQPDDVMEMNKGDTRGEI
jgi:hypothetical protein